MKLLKQIVEIQSNLNDGNSNTTYICLKFVNFPSTIDLVILSNLQLQ